MPSTSAEPSCSCPRRSPPSAPLRSRCRWKPRCCTATARTGVVSCARSSRSRRTTGSWAWARWVAAARTRRARSRASAAISPGHDVFALEALKLKICNPTASLYNNRTQLHAAIEFACLDIMGQKLGVPVHALLGGKLRDTVEFASYLFFRYADPDTGKGEVRTAEQLVAHAAALKATHGFTSHKLKGGVYPPAHELACYRALAASLPGRAVPLRSQFRTIARRCDRVRPQHPRYPQRLLRRPGVGHAAAEAIEGIRAVADGHQHRRRQFRAARRQRPVGRGGRDPARHNVLGRHSSLHQGRRRLRDDGPRRGRA